MVHALFPGLDERDEAFVLKALWGLFLILLFPVNVISRLYADLFTYAQAVHFPEVAQGFHDLVWYTAFLRQRPQLQHAQRVFCDLRHVAEDIAE